MNFNVPIIKLYSEDFKNTGGASHHSIDFPIEGPLNVIQLRDRSRIHLAEKKPRLLRKKTVERRLMLLSITFGNHLITALVQQQALPAQCLSWEAVCKTCTFI